MPRRKKGRAVHGWLVVDKPQGVGSTQVVSKARWALKAQKAGHAGTLDPLATGVLAIAFGEATKTTPYAMDGEKCYAFTVRWGEARDTDDAEGAVTASAAARPRVEDIEALLPEFVGEVMQRPPDYAAVKVDGARAYDLARQGEAVELAERPIWIESLKLTAAATPDVAEFEMVCGKGGYVRAVARDLGARLGCYGHVAALRRLWSGPFSLDQAISFESLDALRDKAGSAEALLPVAAGLDDIPALAVNQVAAAQLRQGRRTAIVGAAASADYSYGDTVWAQHDGAPIAIAEVRAGDLQPIRVFADMSQDPEADEPNEA